MTQSSTETARFLDSVRGQLNVENLQAFRSRTEGGAAPLPPRVPGGNDFSAEGIAKRRDFLRRNACCPEAACRDPEGLEPDELRGAIENYIGSIQLPLGVVGPLRVQGLFARGDFFFPLATTEGALVASCHRGAYAASLSGGVTSLCVADSVSRAPSFTFSSIVDAGLFIEWAVGQIPVFRALAAATTRHGELLDVKPTLNSNIAFLTFEFKTADAAGQNMVTVATQRICEWIIENSPLPPRVWYVEANLSGDKKATMLSFQSHRGRKVVAEATLEKSVVRRFLRSTPEDMAEYCRVSTLGGIQSGSIGVQGHYANALAALFLCCGQDVACLAEASVGITTMQVDGAGDLYVSVSLPNLTVGTVGGGTFMPTARACLQMLGCDGQGQARKFAELCGALVLAGEVSIIAALAGGDFARAHATFRHRQGGDPPAADTASR